MRLISALCCESVVVDQFTNRVSIFNLLEEVITPTLPVGIFVVANFALWEREPGEADSRASLIVRMNTNQLTQLPFEIAFQDKSRCRTIVGLSGIVLNEVGQLTFEITVGDAIYSTWRVPVSLVAQQTAEAVAPAAPPGGA